MFCPLSKQVGKLCELLCFVCELVHTCEVLQFMNDYFDLLERAKHLGIQLPHYEIRRAEKKEKRPIIKDEAADLQEVKRWLNNSEKLGAFSRDKASFVFVVEQFEELRPKNKNVWKSARQFLPKIFRSGSKNNWRFPFSYLSNSINSPPKINVGDKNHFAC